MRNGQRDRAIVQRTEQSCADIEVGQQVLFDRDLEHRAFLSVVRYRCSSNPSVSIVTRSLPLNGVLNRIFVLSPTLFILVGLHIDLSFGIYFERRVGGISPSERVEVLRETMFSVRTADPDLILAGFRRCMNEVENPLQEY